MTRVICVASGKGGVGKTMLTTNLGRAMAELGNDVIVIDGNLTTPNVGIHVGLPLCSPTLHDVLKGRVKIQSAIYNHHGLKVIPSGLTLDDLRGTDPRNLSDVILDLIGKTDTILIDASAGLGKETLSAMGSADELLLVTTPELPALADALKAARLAERLGTKITGTVVNRLSPYRYHMRPENIARMLDTDILAVIPEDRAVQRAIASRTSILHHSPRNVVSRNIRGLAANMLGLEIQVPWYKKILGSKYP